MAILAIWVACGIFSMGMMRGGPVGIFDVIACLLLGPAFILYNLGSRFRP